LLAAVSKHHIDKAIGAIAEEAKSSEQSTKRNKNPK